MARKRKRKRFAFSSKMGARILERIEEKKPMAFVKDLECHKLDLKEALGNRHARRKA
jgi:hypothetical protein